MNDLLSSLRPGDRPLVYYDPEDDHWHERLLPSPCSRASWVVATPTYDIYEEDLTENLDVRKVGPRGGGGVRGNLFRFVPAELAAR